MNPAEVRVVFMGSPAFAVPALRALAAAGYNLAAAVTQPDRPAGRGGAVHSPEVAAAARELGLPILQPPTLKDPAAQEQLAALAPDVLVVAAYGQILPRAVLALPRRGSLNVHGSLLPRWRGASPIAAAILAGDAETGVSIMEMVPRMDAGPVVARASTPITPADTTATLGERLASLGANLLAETLPGWYEGVLPAVPQDDALATYCRLVAKEDGHLAASMTAGDGARAVRAYDPWPGAFVIYRGARLAIWKAHAEPNTEPATPGALLVLPGRRPAIAFHEGLLVLDEVQRPGARRQDGVSFVNGERGQPAPVVELA